MTAADVTPSTSVVVYEIAERLRASARRSSTARIDTESITAPSSGLERGGGARLATLKSASFSGESVTTRKSCFDTPEPPM